ncbi:hypothetical protein [Cyanobium sp. CH-040]|uniref:hypothetical protein n=1 Tax=Cyanobium sp. CH-040 TaxID=2823708 RepID=UPI0020CE5F84|nr:hypothetical protein [Cyanobium sp. CH-040]MCP9927256.1 hypothetical protein [Cyanobium sp. CH-040]
MLRFASPPSPGRRRPGPGPLATALLRWAGLLLVLAMAPAAQTPARASEPPYPTREQLRELQLATFNCARENQAGDCDGARLQADPLLDHPRLPGSCKDALWEIREQAVTAPENSFERRDRLDRAGQDLMRFCPRNAQPATPRANSSPPRPAPGFGFSGGGGR